MRYFYDRPMRLSLFTIAISLIFVLLQPISIAHADDVNSQSIKGGVVVCNPEYGNGNRKYEKTPQGEGNEGWWWCHSSKDNHRVSYDKLNCDSGYKATMRQVQGSTSGEGPYQQGRCVELSKEEQIKNARKKASIEAAGNKANMSNLENLLTPNITESPWYKGLSDNEKLEAGCATVGDSINCDQNARNRLAKNLIGTCIVSAEESVSSRTNGDTSANAKDRYFTDCIGGRSGLDRTQIVQNMNSIAWNDVKKEVDSAAQAAEDALNKSDDSKDEEKNSCGIDGIGWLLCPIITFMGNIGDATYAAISQFLSIDPGIFKNDSTSGGLKQAWDFFRDIANAIFAIVFLSVIFSQVSSIGISNYGIKKILPRLIIGALLVNLSFYICQLAVDLSNILGVSLKGILEGAAAGIDTQSAANGTFSSILATALVATGLALFAFLAVSIPTLLALLLSLLVVMIILIARQAAIILLIAISPVAFATWLLPNTENLFKKWVSIFRGLLIVFPVISLLYGAGKLAAAILAASATDMPDNPKETMQIAALGASIIPLGTTPFVLKGSLNSLGSIGGKISGLSGLANKRLRGMALSKSRIGDLRNRWNMRSARKQADRRSGNTWLGRKADSLRGSDSRLTRGVGIALNPRRAFDSSAAGRFFGLSEGVNAAQEASDKFAREEAQRSFIYEHNGDAVAALKSKNKHVQKIAAEELAKKGEWGATQMAQYLEGGGKITSIGMADALTTMKGAHAGVSEAGTEALRQMQAKNGPSEVGFSPGKLSEFAASGVGKLSGEAIAKQSANAINSSKLSPEQASRILDNERLRSTMSKSTEEALQSIADTLKTSQENKNSRTENTPPANNEGSGLFIAHSQDDIRKAVEEQTKRQNRP